MFSAPFFSSVWMDQAWRVSYIMRYGGGRNEEHWRRQSAGNGLSAIAHCYAHQSGTSWLSEKAALEQEIALNQRRLALINGRLYAAGFLIKDDLPSKYGDAKLLAPTNRVRLIDVIEKIANDSPHPISKAELRRGLVAMGLPLESFNNYFYQAIRRLRSAGRISVLKDGKLWRP